MKKHVVLIMSLIFFGSLLMANTNNTLRSTNTESSTNTLTTNKPKIPDVNIHFAVIGNTRINYDIYKQLADSIMKTKPDFVINTGGVVNVYNNDNEWLKFKKASKPIFDSVPYYCVPSFKEVFSTTYYQLFKLKNNKAYFSITNQNSLFLFLNSNNVRAGDEQLTWLTDLLEKSNKFTFKFIILNFPIYSSGQLGGDLKLQILLQDLIKKYEIDMVIAGHDRNYERLKVQKTTYIISGGGGAPTTPMGTKDENNIMFKSTFHYCNITIHNRTLSCKAIDKNGTVIDEFQIHKLR